MGTIRDVFLRTSCETCTNKCCSQPFDWVYLTNAEVDDLARVSGLEPTEFVSEHINENTGHWFRVLMLPCRFLDEKTGRCTVYDRRPLICRAFPLYPEPLTGNACLLPAQCGVHLTVLSHREEGAWGLQDIEDELKAWLKNLWAEAAARQRSSQNGLD
jgi:Fe-S-cluster containining protein